MSLIIDINARQILDSRGNPTIEVEVLTENGKIGRASVPSGASTGTHEAIELRDQDLSRYNGKGVLQAVANVKQILAKELQGLDVFEQNTLDQLMLKLDGSQNKGHIGANAILGTSLAIARAAAQESHQPFYRYIGGINANTLPVPMMNILNGGAHADNNIDFQEFMIVPLGASSFSEALRWGTEIFHKLKALLKDQGYATNFGDEGGFAPNLDSNEAAIEMVLRAIEAAKYKPGIEVWMAVDAAASELYDAQSGSYSFGKSDPKTLTSIELVNYWVAWTKKYPIISLEDALAEDDWNGWSELSKVLSHKIQLVGDDLFVTNVQRLQKGIDLCVANSVLIKVNQVGSLSETIDTVRLAQNNAYTTVMSHRSGETEDTTIADLSVALNCGQIKTGSPCRSDRVAKYNQLLRIEEELGSNARFLGDSFKFLKVQN